MLYVNAIKVCLMKGLTVGDSAFVFDRSLATTNICFMGCVIDRIDMAFRSYSVLDILLPSIIIIVQNYSQALNTYKCM